MLLFTASGTGAFESVYANLVEPGDRVLCVTAGAFGDRWVAMARAFGADVTVLECEWGRPPDPAVVAEAMADETLRLAVVVHSETSTATVTDIQAIGELTRGRTCLLAIDAVSSLGAVPIETDAWGLDVVVSGSQKGMSTPPGLSFASVSPAAWERSRQTGTPRFYFDWKRTLDAQNGGGSPFTPATATVNALDVALDRVLDEGLEAIWERTRGLAGRFRARVLASGLELYSPDDESCSLVTAVPCRRAPTPASCGARCSPPATSSRAAAAVPPARCCASGTSARPTRMPSTPASTRCWPRSPHEPTALRRRRADRRGRPGAAARGLSTSSSSSPAPICARPWPTRMPWSCARPRPSTPP